MNTIPLTTFADLQTLENYLAATPDTDDEVCPTVAAGTFKGYVLAALSHIPILRDLPAVVDYCNQLQSAEESALIENAQALGVFMHALAAKYGDRATERALMINDVSYDGHTPLNARVVSRVIETAEKLTVVRNDSQPIGFENKGLTCYANSALKMLIAAMGEDVLVDHLNNLVHTCEDPRKQDAAKKFLILLDAYAAGGTTAGSELRAFFKSLQKTRQFKSDFQIIWKQNDAHEFMQKLLEAMDLHKAAGFGLGLQATKTFNGETRPGSTQSPFMQTINIGSDDLATMQGIMDRLCADELRECHWNDEDTFDSKVNFSAQWTTPDLTAVKRLTIDINPVVWDRNSGETTKTILKDAKFGSNVFIVIHDEKTKEKYQVELEPREIVVQDGGVNSGHYTAYTNNGFGTWLYHDDADVKEVKGIAPGHQAKLISYAVKSAEKWTGEWTGKAASVMGEPLTASSMHRSARG
ncbi:type III secretion system effector BopA family protein [Bordetella sp. 15P40C-2]|uniref:type III secretion system effector BopA family protein n=1 Tax=Bordetella sp. 15P40C-2 TaxID=2572246 RepID=UPI0013297387|nr:type III secretion system effector BopA family protein [Bordetella sp. 15P40C-2]MVW70394.1 hypothetical protein [Bordetella sp. 15P40C-2]